MSIYQKYKKEALGSPLFSFPNLGFDFEGGTNNDIVSNNIVPTSTSTTTTESGNGGFFSGFNINTLLDTVIKGGATWAQIEQAKNGKPLFVKDNEGNTQDITPTLISKLNETSSNNNLSVTDMLALLKSQSTPPETKDNTLVYVSIGAGTLVLGTLAFLIMNSNKNKK